MQLHVIPSHFTSVVTESGMAEEVKMVKKNPWFKRGMKNVGNLLLFLYFSEYSRLASHTLQWAF